MRGGRGPGASVQDRDALEALDEGKACWPGLREGVYDGAFAAERLTLVGIISGFEALLNPMPIRAPARGEGRPSRNSSSRPSDERAVAVGCRGGRRPGTSHQRGRPYQLASAR